MGYIPKPGKLGPFIADLKKNAKIAFSESLVERISSSGDTTGTPFYHWRWKQRSLADVVVWPKSEEDLSFILKIANKHNIPITPRGAGSCYYGSGAPTMGGVVLDTKQMKSFKIDKIHQTVTTQAGICFAPLMDALDQSGLLLPSFPTSALTSTVGGWIGTGAKMGIGTFQNGPMIDQVLQLRVVTPTGEVQTLTDRKDFEIYFGTNGIFGVISDVTIKLLPKTEQTPLFFGFNSLEDILSTVEVLAKETNVFVIRFSDVQHEVRCSGFSIYSHYLFVVLSGPKEQQEKDLKIINDTVKQRSGVYLGEEFSHRTWQDYLKYEMKVKLETPVQMLQQIYLPFSKCHEIIELFEKLAVERDLNHCYYGLINKDMNVRIALYTPTDNAYWVHFLSSKAVAHRVVKALYSRGGRIYTYGLQNSIYLHKFEGKKKRLWQIEKKKRDPKFILNPLKVVESKMTFSRVNWMFELNMLWRKIAAKRGKAEKILEIDIPHNKMCREKYLGKR